MPENRWSAHIGYPFTELPLFERIAAAAEAGFTAIEHPPPFAIPAAEMKAELASHTSHRKPRSIALPSCRAGSNSWQQMPCTNDKTGGLHDNGDQSDERKRTGAL